MKSIDLILTTPPPSLNNAYYNSSRGGRRKSGKYIAWLKEAGWELKEQKPGYLAGKFGLECEVGRDLTKADLDNLAKPILDLLVKHQVVPDDSMLTELSMKYTARDDLKLRVFTVEGA